MAELHLGTVRGPQGIEQLVVVKRVLPEYASRPDFVAMFLDEARLAATLRHPNIVQIHQVGEDAEGLFLTMEYLEGVDLRRLLRRHAAPIPVPFAVQIAIGLLAGLHHAHNQVDRQGRPLHIVHRDVSPQNGFVSVQGAVKVLDFGVAKATGNKHVDGEFVQGKLRYMSPEQCLNAELDARSDVYAVGAVFYELLTHHHAHPGHDPAAIQRVILDQSIVPPSGLGLTLPPGLEPIVMRALKQKRQERYASARDFQVALEAWCEEQKVFLSSTRLGQWVETFTERENPGRNRTSGITNKGGARPLSSTEHAELQRLGDLTVVRLFGRLDERFDGAAVGRQLEGPTILDLEGVTRISSFGIRGWLEMLRTSRCRPLYLTRVPDAFVNQISLVRGLVGTGNVVSFMVPFQCEEEDVEIHLLLQGVDATRLVTEGIVPVGVCPNNHKHTLTFDEEPGLYKVLADNFLAEPPAEVSRAIEVLIASVDRPALEKTLEEDSTVLHVRRALDDKLRWGRLLAGVEGPLVLDLTAVTSFDPGGLEVLSKAIGAITEDLTELTIRNAPIPLVNSVMDHPGLVDRLHVEGLVAQMSCPNGACSEIGITRGVTFPDIVSLGESAPCRACASPMVFKESLRGLQPAVDEVVEVPRGCLSLLWPWS